MAAAVSNEGQAGRTVAVYLEKWQFQFTPSFQHRSAHSELATELDALHIRLQYPNTTSREITQVKF